jgi:hypothetical protein
MRIPIIPLLGSRMYVVKEKIMKQNNMSNVTDKR